MGHRAATTPDPHAADSRRWRAHASLASEAGDTLIEVLVSAALLVIVVVGALSGFDAAGKASVNQRQYAQADAVAQQDEERLLSMPIANVLSSVGSPTANTTTVTDGGTPFTVYHTAAYESDSTGTVPCSPNGTGTADYLRTDSYAQWKTASVTHTVKESSVITPPQNAAMVVHDTDWGGNPITGVPVTVQQGSTVVGSQNTDSNGCAIFTGLADGTYTVGVSAPGDVDQSRLQAPTKSATVVTGVSTPVTFTYAPAAYVTAQYISTQLNALGQPTGIGTTTTGDSFTVYNSQTVPAGTTYPFPATAPSGPPLLSSVPTSAPGLFPFSYGSTPSGVAYSVYAGACASDDPAKVSGGSITDVTAALTPGSTPTVQLYEPPVVIRILDSNGNGVTTAPTDIHVTDTGVGCNNVTRVYKAINGALAGNPTTSSTGALVQPDLPYGTYKVCVDMGGKSSSLSNLTNATVNGLTPPSNAVTINFKTSSSSSACSP